MSQLNELLKDIRKEEPPKPNTPRRLDCPEQVMAAMQAALIDELTARTQYLGHAQIAKARGYAKLAAQFEDRYKDEDRHADLWCLRIRMYGGVPVMTPLAPLKVFTAVPEQLTGDLSLELGAIEKYNAMVELAREAKCGDIRMHAEKILDEEVEHAHELQQLQDQIADVALDNFLSMQV